MLTFRITRTKFEGNSFCIKKDTSIKQAKQKFYYIISYSTENSAFYIAEYEYNVELEKYEVCYTFITFRDLKESYRSVIPYYNTKYLRGNIWKQSYPTLLLHFQESINDKLYVDKLVYKRNPSNQCKIAIMDYEVIVKNGLSDNRATVAYCYKKSKDYRVITSIGKQLRLKRTQFRLFKQDEFILLAVRPKLIINH